MAGCDLAFRGKVALGIAGWGLQRQRLSDPDDVICLLGPYKAWYRTPLQLFG